MANHGIYCYDALLWYMAMALLKIFLHHFLQSVRNSAKFLSIGCNFCGKHCRTRFYICHKMLFVLIEAHLEHDDKKFMNCAEFIADCFADSGDEVSEQFIRSRLDGSYMQNDHIKYERK
ncbi:MAG: hypothetical protein LIO94_07870 [Clostridiales bacterium]|nr:hypothetical protein [Clostridiales bacterium]